MIVLDVKQLNIVPLWSKGSAMRAIVHEVVWNITPT